MRDERDAPQPSMLDLRPSVLAWLASWLGWMYLHFVGKTSRVARRCHPDAQSLLDSGAPFIYAFWHRYQLMMMYDQRDRGIHVLVSRSRDGEIIAQALRRFGYDTARGSSSRGGVRALLQLLARARDGKCIAFTPDGPRGPYRSLQPGVVLAARRSGLPIVPCGWSGARVKELNSWDRFLVPLPFGRYEIVLGEPLRLSPEEAGAEERVSRALDAAAEKAEEALQNAKRETQKSK